MALMGAETLMGEDKWEAFFSTPARLHTIIVLPLVAAHGVLLSYAALQTMIFSHRPLVSNVVG